MLSVWDDVLSVGCKGPCMGGGDHTIGDEIVGVGVAECTRWVTSCVHIARLQFGNQFNGGVVNIWFVLKKIEGV